MYVTCQILLTSPILRINRKLIKQKSLNGDKLKILEMIKEKTVHGVIELFCLRKSNNCTLKGERSDVSL